jgi:hypothetical protein
MNNKAKLVIGLFLVALALAYVWRYRHSALVKGLVTTEDARPAHIQFDNGTVRNTEPASAASGATPARVLPPDQFRRCSDGKSVVYTDRPCPPSSKEMPPQNKGTLNVMRN